MSDKEKQTPQEVEETTTEPILDFEDAKDMTVGQAMRKSEEIEAGVTDQDSVLDKYIKQHKEEILAGKFDTVHGIEPAVSQREEVSETPKISEMDLSPTSLDDFIAEVRSGEEKSAEVQEEILSEDIEFPSAAEVIAAHEATQAEAETEVEPSHTHGGYDEVPVTDTVPIPEPRSPEVPNVEPKPVSVEPVFTSEVKYQWDKEVPLYKRKSVLYTSVALLAVLLAGGALYLGMQRNSGTTANSSSQTSTSSSSTSTSSSAESNQKAFDDLYASFFTDDKQTALKNSAFGNLDNLKSALDKLEGSSGYDAAKKKYDDLVTQISAIQSVNGQFTTAAITDGVVDTNAQAKSDALFKDTTTGNANTDKLLSQAIQQGRAQTIPAPGPVQAAPATTTPATQPQTDNTLNIQNAGVPGFGLSSAGVNLQRNLSRVPYNQDAINDVNNPAWTFNSGVLEKILQTARERGHITGDQYILEKVNIINGNGYYNLFKPDGTYLFSINAKTGYFVGNGKGHADALDY